MTKYQEQINQVKTVSMWNMWPVIKLKNICLTKSGFFMKGDAEK